MKMSLVEKLYERYNKGDKNFLVSPYSIHVALAMAKEGARGETLAQMEAVLGEDPTIIHSEVLKVANAIWLRDVIVQAWKQIIQDKYEGEAKDIRDVPNPEGLINRWVSEKTMGKITKLLEPGQLDREDRVIITNAIHFKDDWMSQFKKSRTKKEPFYAPGVTTTVGMMYGMKTVPYFETNDFQAIGLPYKHDKISMFLILPRSRTGTVSLEDLQLVRRVGYFSLTEVRVYIPKFTMQKDYSLKQALTEMGMPIPFSDFADFNDMAKDVKIGNVIHKTFIDVDEEGTEAAAATGVVMRTLSAMMPSPQKVFRADHPFTFYIEDRSTGTILFLGALKSPKSQLVREGEM